MVALISLSFCPISKSVTLSTYARFVLQYSKHLLNTYLFIITIL